MEKLQEFIKNQIQTYDKENDLEFILGNRVEDNIFNNSIFSEETVNKIIKNFRHYKLSYSQGKIYKYLNYELKTFNNKFSEICKKVNLENQINNIETGNLDILLLNNQVDSLQEFEIKSKYVDEHLYDELNVHLDDNVILVFRNIDKETYSIRYLIKLEKNLPLKFQDDYIKKVEESLKIIISYII